MNYIFLFFGAFQLGSVFHDFQMNSVAADTAVAFGIGAILLFIGWRGLKKKSKTESCRIDNVQESIVEEIDEVEQRSGGDGITFKENGVRFL